MKKMLTLLAFLYTFTLLHGQGDTLFRSFTHEDSLRSYILYVPEAYDGSEEWPLVINAHGYALDAFFQMIFSNMNPVADTAHFLIAYPQGTPLISTVPNIPPQGLGFNIGGERDSAFYSPTNVDDVDFISKIIDHISADYQVAEDQIYATGFSNGAMLSTVLACELGDRIAAIAPVGGTVPILRGCNSNEAKPVLYIYGTEDPIAPYDGSEFLISVEETLELWSTKNGCNSEPTVTPLPDLVTTDTSTVELIQWQNCEVEVAHLKVIGGGHQWPGGVNLLPFLGYFNQDIHASSEIWNFFSRNSLPQATARVQFIHAAPNETVDVFANGELLLDNFAWRTATPFLDIPADTTLAIELVPVNPFSTAQTTDLELEFESGNTYVVAVNGTFDDSDPWSVEATVRDNAVEQASDPSKVATTFFQGVPDFPLSVFDIIIIGEEGVLWDDAVYKSFFEYQEVPPGPIEYSSTLADDNSMFLTPFIVDFSFWKGKSAVQFNTGLFSDTTWTEPWVALSNGGTYPLRPPMDNQPLIQNQETVYQLEVAPNPARNLVNIRFELKQESPVLLDLFDSSGKFVRNIQVGNLSKGIHRFELDVAELPTGLYRLQLKSRTDEEVQTLMVVNK